MTPEEEAVVRQRIDHEEEELCRQVKTDGEWDTDVWHELYEVLRLEGDGMASTNPLATTRYAHAAKLLVDFLNDEPDLQQLSLLYWNIGSHVAQAQRMLVAMQSLNQIAVHVAPGHGVSLAQLCGEFAFTDVEKAILCESLQLCVEQYNRLSDLLEPD